MTSPKIPWLLLIAIGGGLLRLSFCFLATEDLDSRFFPDDTYYTLGIARSLAQGKGPSLEGILTNGFQPLLAFIEACWFRVGLSWPAVLRTTLATLALFDALSIFLLGTLAERWGGRAAGALAGLGWALSFCALSNLLTALEASLVLTFLLLATHATFDALISSRLRPAVLGGVWGGLAILARIDALPWLGLAACVLVRQRRLLVSFVGAAVLILLPWTAYSLEHFGTFIPLSGVATKLIVDEHRALYLGPTLQIAWGGSFLGPGALLDLSLLRELSYKLPWAGVTFFSVSSFAVIYSAVRGIRHDGAHRAALPLLLHALFLTLFYLIWLPSPWFQQRYLIVPEAVSIALLAVGIVRIAYHPQTTVRLCPFVLSLYVAPLLLAFAEAAQLRLGSTLPKGGLEGAKGYAKAAQELHSKLPRPAILGAFQSGALSFFAPEGTRVLNLDGVVNHEAYLHGKRGTLSDYCHAQGLSLFVDWPFNAHFFQVRSSRSEWSGNLVPLPISIGPQGSDRFTIYQVDWIRSARALSPSSSHDSAPTLSRGPR